MLKVMIVSNEMHCLNELRGILSAGSSYEICGEFSEAFSAMQALARVSPDILLADVLLPGMSGIGLAMRVKQQYPDIKIVLIVVSSSLAVEGYEVGAVGVILKPITAKSVLKTLKRLTCRDRNVLQ